MNQPFDCRVIGKATAKEYLESLASSPYAYHLEDDNPDGLKWAVLAEQWQIKQIKENTKKAFFYLSGEECWDIYDAARKVAEAKAEGKPKHTPGPWVRSGDSTVTTDCDEISDEEGFVLVHVERTGGLQNTDLILSAPEMYATLDQIITEMQAIANMNDDDTIEQMVYNVAEMAGTILKKARGET